MFQRKRWSLLAIPVLAAVLLLAGCGGNGGSGDGGNATAADAETVYKRHCLSCHGTDLSGQHLNTVGSRLSMEEIEQKIRNGGGGMPPFANRLNDEQINNLSAWLVEMK